MDVQQATQTARCWVEANSGRWPGLRAAHLVGGITALADDALFPAEKDVDLHLVFAEGSPMLADEGNRFGILEETFGGISLEAGMIAHAYDVSFDPETDGLLLWGATAGLEIAP